jgi:hypothetical protein
MASFDTTEYEAAMGHKPRGYGIWTFSVGRSNYAFVGTYPHVKGEAAKAARFNGISRVRLTSWPR